MSVHFAFHFKKSENTASSPTAGDGGGLFFKGDNGATVLLIHGLTGSPWEMGFLAKFLHRKGYTVVCPRLANHGSPMEIFKKTTWQQMYGSVRKAFLGLGPDGQGPVFVAGLSVGALFALLLADEFQGGVMAVGCLSPILFFDGWNAPKRRFWLPLAYHTPLKDYAFFKETPPYGIKSEAIRRRVHQYYHNTTMDNMGDVSRHGYPFYPVSLLYQHHLMLKYLKKRIPYIKTPVQIMQAREDDMSSIKNSQFLYDRIGSRTKEVVLLDDSYHVIIADQEREKVGLEMCRFFVQQGTGYAH